MVFSPFTCVGLWGPIRSEATVQSSRSMRPPRVVEIALLCAFLACGRVTAASAQALPAGQPAAAGAEALANARAAWDKGAYDTAETFYKSALERGGLAPTEVVDGYVHLGAARAVLKRVELSRAAFRQAARLDLHFRVPPEAGRRAAQIAALAKRDEARLGSIVFRAQVPSTVAAGVPFKVTATLDAKHTASVVARVGIDARDIASGKQWNRDGVAATRSTFEIPVEVVTPGAVLMVRVDALDAHDNRLASREQRVQVEGSPPAPPAPPATTVAVTPPSSSPSPPATSAPAATSASSAGSAISAGRDPTKPALGLFEPIPPESATRRSPSVADSDRDRPPSSGGGFWSSPWPYVIGGAALAAGGATVYFVTRPTDNVSVGSAQVQPR